MLPLVLLLFSVASLHGVTSADSCKKIASFNAALLHRVDTSYAERIPGINEALYNVDADVVCLQEVWLESDMRRIINSLGFKYPHHYSEIHYRQGHLRKPKSEMGWWEKFTHLISVFSPCSVTDFASLTFRFLPCVLSNGCLPIFAQSNTRGLQCFAQNCAEQMKSLQASCVSCLSLMSGGVTEVFEACGPDYSKKENDMNTPGLVMLSKTPMNDIRYTDYFPDNRMVTRRGYLETEVDGVGKVVCSHLTSTYGNHYYEYDLSFDSFAHQNVAEIQILLNTFGSVEHLLVGDLNVGPTVVNMDDAQKNLTGENENNYKMFIQGGYSAPYFESDGRCTFCSHNPLVSSSNNVIDHILVKGQGQDLRNAQRIMDQVEPRPLSDHFGIQAEICTES